MNRQRGNKVTRYAIRKFGVGVASVAVAAGIFFGSDAVILAEEAGAATVDVDAGSTEASVATPVVEETPAPTVVEEVVEAEVQSEDTNQAPAVEEPKVDADVVEKKTTETKEEETNHQKQEPTQSFKVDPNLKPPSAAMPRPANAGQTIPEGVGFRGNGGEETPKNNQQYTPYIGTERFEARYKNLPDAKEAIKNNNALPEGTKFAWKDQSVFNQLGQRLGTVIVTYPDGTTDEVEVPVTVGNSYEIDGVKYSGTRYSEEAAIKTENKDGFFLTAMPSNIDSNEERAKSEFDVKLTNLTTLNHVGQTQYKLNLELDDRIARYVTEVQGFTSSQTGMPIYANKPFTYERVKTVDGKLTNTWRKRAYSAPTSDPASKSQGWDKEEGRTPFDGVELVEQKSNVKIKLSKTIAEILAENPTVKNGDLTFDAYILNEDTGRAIERTKTNRYFEIEKSKYDETPEGTVANKWFTGTGGKPRYEANVGKNGGILFDQMITKNTGALGTYGGTTKGAVKNNWTYHYQIDERLLPFIDGVEIYYLKNGPNFVDFDKKQNILTMYENQSDYDKKEGWNNFESLFNPGEGRDVQYVYTAGPDGKPQTGSSGLMSPIAMFSSVKGDPEKQAGFKEKPNTLKAGQGYFTLDAILANPNP